MTNSGAVALADLVAAAPWATAVVDAAGHVLAANPAWAEVAGDLGNVLAPGWDHSTDGAGTAAVAAVLRGEAPEAVARLRVGSSSRRARPRFVDLRVATIGAGSSYALATCSDVESLDGSGSSRDLVDRHPLTGFMGRRLFLELLAQAMTMSDRHRYHPAALAIGIVGMAEVEATLGAAARHELTVAVASRLRSGLRPGDVVAQIGPEQFAVMLPDVSGSFLAESVAYRLGVDAARPFRLGDRRVEVRLHVGVATSETSKHAPDVLEAAERALAEAGEQPDTPIALASGGSAAVAGGRPRRTINVADLREEELVSYFQPIFDIADGRVVAGEALMRWRHPHYGVLSAGEFLGLAINSGMLATLSDQALVRSAETWADLRDRLGPRPPQLFLNLSPDQLLSRVAVDRLYHLLVATGLPSEDVVVEVTEEAMSTRFGEMLSVLNELRVHGLRVALDDFGSGYSSLGRLRHLPVDVIKVDQSMVRGLESDRRARQLLAAVSTMADELDVECVVEGVETAGEAAIVGDLGFRYVQGYHFARPCPADEFASIVDLRDRTFTASER